MRRLDVVLAFVSFVHPASCLRAQNAPPTGDHGAGYTTASHTFSSDSLHLRFTYPDVLQPQPAETAVTHGRIHLLGLDADRVTQDSSVDLTACLRPLFFARSAPPTPPSTTTEHTARDGSSTTVEIHPAAVASILLADLDTSCLSAHQQVTRTDLLATLAQQFLTSPGMTRNAGPSSYTVGYQRVIMAAAQGHPQSTPTPDPQPAAEAGTPPAASPLTVFTMAIATNWSNHLLVWLLSANRVELLDQLSKSTVRFGRSAPLPLYPETLGDSTPAGSR